MYIYNDEDNAPMNDERWEQFHLMLEAKEADREAKEKEQLNGVLDMLKLEGGCRKCPFMTWKIKGYMREAEQITSNQLEFLRLQCAGCHGKGTGKIQPEHEKRLAKDWIDLIEWCDLYELNQDHCPWCGNVYEVYGQYKDPDDEWKAMESLCGNCKYFGED